MSQTIHRLLGMALTGVLGVAAAAMAEPPKHKASHASAAELQQVIPPKTVYWLSAATQNGFSMGGKPPSSGDMMKMAMGGGMGGVQKQLTLDLGSSLPPAGPPQASHAIPPVMNMGKALALRSPKPVAPSQPQSHEREPEHRDFERPKGRILLFWGCGETAHAKQPVVFDFSKLAAGQPPPNMFAGETVRVANPPSAGSWPTYGFWPNDDRGSRQSVPADSSLLGPHKVTGNYTPDIAFTLDQDWMGALNMVQTKLPSGALQLEWNGLPGATGHFAQLMGASRNADGGSDIVFWSSSETQTFISGLTEFIAPTEAARLVDHRYLMPPSQTKCVVPKEVMAATQGGMISLVTHGPEQNVVYPPRPQDPHTPWVQEWAVKARFVSRTGGMAGMNMPTADRSGKADQARCAPRPSGASMLGSALGGSLGGALGGMLSKPAKPDGCPN
jgi:hypothetical protein